MSIFGSALQNAIESIKAKTDKERAGKQERLLAKWIPEAKASRKTKFKDPASR